MFRELGCKGFEGEILRFLERGELNLRKEV